MVEANMQTLSMNAETVEAAVEAVRTGNFLPPLRDSNVGLPFEYIEEDDDVEDDQASDESVDDEVEAAAERRHSVDLYEEDAPIPDSFDEIRDDEDDTAWCYVDPTRFKRALRRSSSLAFKLSHEESIEESPSFVPGNLPQSAGDIPRRDSALGEPTSSPLTPSLSTDFFADSHPAHTPAMASDPCQEMYTEHVEVAVPAPGADLQPPSSEDNARRPSDGDSMAVRVKEQHSKQRSQAVQFLEAKRIERQNREPPPAPRPQSATPSTAPVEPQSGAKASPPFMRVKVPSILEKDERLAMADDALHEAHQWDKRGEYAFAYDLYRESFALLLPMWQAETNHNAKKEMRKQLHQVGKYIAELRETIIPDSEDLRRPGKPQLDYGLVMERRKKAREFPSDEPPIQYHASSPKSQPPMSSGPLARRDTVNSSSSTTESRSRSPGRSPGRSSGTVVPSIEATSATPPPPPHVRPAPSPSRDGTPASSKPRAMTPIEELRALTPDHPRRGMSAYVPDTTDDPRALKSRKAGNPNYRRHQTYGSGDIWHDHEQSATKSLIQQMESERTEGQPSPRKDVWWDGSGTYDGEFAMSKHEQVDQLRECNPRPDPKFPVLIGRALKFEDEDDEDEEEMAGQAERDEDAKLDKMNEVRLAALCRKMDNFLQERQVHSATTARQDTTPRSQSKAIAARTGDYIDALGKMEEQCGRPTQAERDEDAKLDKMNEARLAALSSKMDNVLQQRHAHSATTARQDTTLQSQSKAIAARTGEYIDALGKMEEQYERGSPKLKMLKRKYEAAATRPSPLRNEVRRDDVYDDEDKENYEESSHRESVAVERRRWPKASKPDGSLQDSLDRSQNDWRRAMAEASRMKALLRSGYAGRGFGPPREQEEYHEQQRDEETEDEAHRSSQTVSESERHYRFSRDLAPSSQEQEDRDLAAALMASVQTGQQSSGALQKGSTKASPTLRLRGPGVKPNPMFKVHDARFRKDRHRTLEYCVSFGSNDRPRYVEGTDPSISGTQWYIAIDQYWKCHPRGRSGSLLTPIEQNPHKTKKAPY
ncbi:hypothetical protein SMMN14_01465 [Sphaerulina musiva]